MVTLLLIQTLIKLNLEVKIDKYETILLLIVLAQLKELIMKIKIINLNFME